MQSIRRQKAKASPCCSTSAAGGLSHSILVHFVARTWLTKGQMGALTTTRGCFRFEGIGRMRSVGWGGSSMFRRFLATCALLAAMTTGANAAGPFGSIHVGNWIGGAFSDDTPGAFSH